MSPAGYRTAPLRVAYAMVPNISYAARDSNPDLMGKSQEHQPLMLTALQDLHRMAADGTAGASIGLSATSDTQE
jgi:hypothetical protein